MLIPFLEVNFLLQKLIRTQHFNPCVMTGLSLNKLHALIAR